MYIYLLKLDGLVSIHNSFDAGKNDIIFVEIKININVYAQKKKLTLIRELSKGTKIRLGPSWVEDTELKNVLT